MIVAGTEVVEFSKSADLAPVMATIARNITVLARTGV